VDDSSIASVAAQGDGRIVVQFDLLARCDDEATDDWTFEPRRSSGRVVYMPVGALLDRTLVEQEFVDVEQFRSEPLPQGDWVVELRVPGHVPEVERVDSIHGGWGSYDFVAHLRPGAEHEFDVRLPDGTQPERALYYFGLRDPREQRALGPRPEHARAASDYYRPEGLWTPTEPRVCVEPINDGLVTDLIFFAEPSGESPYDARSLCRYVSSTIAVGPEAGAPIRVSLREACTLAITIKGPDQPILELDRWVGAVRLDGCEGYDVDALLASSTNPWGWPRELNDRDELDWYEARGPWNEASPFEGTYLLPGRWHIVAGWEDRPASGVRVVDVAPGRTEVSLTLEQTATDGWIRARFVVAGEIVPEPELDLSFSLVTAAPNAALCEVEDGVSGVGGRWFELGLLRSAQRELVARLDGEVPVHLVAFAGQHKERWYVSAPLRPTDSEIFLEELERARVEVRLSPESPRGTPLAFTGRLVEPSANSLIVQGALPDREFDHVDGRVLFTPSRPSRKLPGTFLPGRWRFEMRVDGKSPLTLTPIELVLLPGPQTLTVTLP